MPKLRYPHLESSPDGIPLIAGTRTKVKEVVLDSIAHHWDAEEIHRQHPHLSLAQIHAAFTYYYDHRQEIDRAIEEDLEEVERHKGKLGDPSIRLKLKAAGRLR